VLKITNQNTLLHFVVM